MLKRYLALFRALNAAQVNFVSLDDLIHLKQAAGRQSDLQDVEILKKIRDGTI